MASVHTVRQPERFQRALPSKATIAAASRLKKVGDHLPRALHLHVILCARARISRGRGHVVQAVQRAGHIPDSPARQSGRLHQSQWSLEAQSTPLLHSCIADRQAAMCALALPQAGPLASSRRWQAAAGTLPPHQHHRLSRCTPQIRCAARKDKEAETGHTASPIVATHLAAALAASVMLGGAIFPEDALAARSGGRVGGSSGFRSAPRAAPRAAPRCATVELDAAGNVAVGLLCRCSSCTSS